MPGDFGAPPKTGWASMVAELHVVDIGASLAFWRDLLGFAIAYQRPDERFVYLERPEGAQVMLCQRHGRWETGPMEYPLGQGVLFQINIESIEPVVAALSAAAWPLHLAPRTIWRRTGDREGGRREIAVQDPDGYLVMIAHDLGERPFSAPHADGTRQAGG